jgi:16S rRNA A1518/A1519 N6-dimethyltransferase RsmA/KsgA/DIM1 with predicted DNA glycosylase/AP lyase activity
MIEIARRAAGLTGALKIVGNIPYNVTTPILFHLLSRPRPAEILLMVQREVADRILAQPGGGEYGALTVGVRAVATAERVLQVPAGAFRPRPKVDSSVVRIVPRVPQDTTPGEEIALRRLTRAVFQWRRKQLGKILREHPDLADDRLRAGGGTGSASESDAGTRPEGSASLADRLLAAAGAEPSARPEEVSPDGFVRMARVLTAP